MWQSDKRFSELATLKGSKRTRHATVRPHHCAPRCRYGPPVEVGFGIKKADAATMVRTVGVPVCVCDHHPRCS